MTTLYLIRHAQSEGNSEGRFQGITDRNLSQTGREQLEYLAERTKDISAACIYSSPLIRAYETAKAANRHLNLEIIRREDIREIDVGLWENQNFPSIEEKWPEQLRLWREEHHSFQAPEGDSMAQVYERVTAALKDIAKNHKDQTVIVVSHGCAIRNMCAWAKGGPREVDSFTIVENTSISRIDVDDEGNPTLVLESDCNHLPEELRWKPQ